jgi:hypothetical protein
VWYRSREVEVFDPGVTGRRYPTVSVETARSGGLFCFSSIAGKAHMELWAIATMLDVSPVQGNA